MAAGKKLTALGNPPAGKQRRIFLKQIAVLGYGVVGSGVVEVLYKNGESISRKAGDQLEVKYILVRRDFPNDPYEDKMVWDFNTIAQDPEVAIVVEAMGGIEPAYTYVKTSLENGKSVVTSNKELVAEKGAQLLKLAEEHHVNFLFEASVGGGIPIVRPLHQCLAANEIDKIEGILNGTTNFILTKMIKEGMGFQEALAIAQQLGYAESDPTADVEGLDACRKICILASIACGQHIYPKFVHTEGITKLTGEDVEYAKGWGGIIKLIGQFIRRENGISMITAPRLVPEDSQLANVDDVFNGILVQGDATGDVVFYGKGAGRLPTASAVVADIIDCAKRSDTVKTLHWDDCQENIVCDYLQEPVRAYLRFAKVQPEQVYAAFPGGRPLSRQNQPQDEAALVTPTMKEAEILEKAEVLKQKGAQLLNMVRVLENE